MSWYMVGGELARTIGPLLVTAAVSLWSLGGVWRLIPLGLLASFILYVKLKDYQPVQNHRQKPIKGDKKAILRDYRFFFLAGPCLAGHRAGYGYLYAHLQERHEHVCQFRCWVSSRFSHWLMGDTIGLETGYILCSITGILQLSEK